MKRLILSILTVGLSATAFSQKLYFIYLQSEPEQAFFVKINDKVHSSTASGYLILSRLKDSTYAITVGFPGNKWPEQRFTISVNAKDHGYSLKNFEDKGWGLYDMESSSVQMSASASSAAARTEPREVSLFTEILSKAANDPSLKEKPVAIKEEKAAAPKEDKSDVVKDEKSVASKEDKPMVTVPTVTKEDVKPIGDPVAPKQDETVNTQKQERVVNNDSVNNDKEAATVVKPTEKDAVTEEYKPSTIRRRSESSMTDGLHLTFIDEYPAGKKDTIRIIIPNQRPGAVETQKQVKEERKFLDLSPLDTSHAGDIVEKPAEKITKSDTARTVTNTKATTSPKKNCSAVATETDFLKIRKNMAAETNDEAMVAVAKKYFKTKCFSSTQIKNLSALFLDDAGKYKFFDAAYDYVTDKENFAALGSELKDDYYINRFKAMLR
jgi:uncharacterized protein DUF4476